MDKSALRKDMKGVLKSLQSAQERSEQALKQVIPLLEEQQPQFVSLFVSLPNEFETKSLAEYCWANQIIVTVPEFERSDEGGHVVFREWVHDATMKQIFPGLQHPEFGPLHTHEEIDIVFVPGLAFTKEGERLGRGKGFYDRLLQDSRAHSVGLCFSEQIRDGLPLEKHDQKVDQVIYC